VGGAVNGDGGYVTRGRAQELFERMNELELTVAARLRKLEQRIDALQEFELALAKARIGAELTVYKQHTSGGQDDG